MRLVFSSVPFTSSAKLQRHVEDEGFGPLEALNTNVVGVADRDLASGADALTADRKLPVGRVHPREMAVVRG